MAELKDPRKDLIGEALLQLGCIAARREPTVAMQIAAQDLPGILLQALGYREPDENCEDLIDSEVELTRVQVYLCMQKTDELAYARMARCASSTRGHDFDQGYFGTCRLCGMEVEKKS